MFRDDRVREGYEKLDSVVVRLWDRFVELENVKDARQLEAWRAARDAYMLAADVRQIHFRNLEECDDMEHDPACHNQTSLIPAVWASDEEGTGYRCPECGGHPKKVVR